MEKQETNFIYQLYINSKNKELEDKWNDEPIEIKSSLPIVVGDFLDITLNKYSGLKEDFKSTRFKVIERTLIMFDKSEIDTGQTIYLEVEPYIA